MAEVTVIQMLLGALFTVVGSGVTAYVGVRVALAEIRGDLAVSAAHINGHCRELADVKADVKRLERAVFER